MSAGDSPIESADEDTLGRAGLATQLASQVVSMDTKRGLVVGVLGPWGSGKTSFVNLARRGLVTNGAAVIDFNPWMFSGAEQLVDRFFIEVGEELKLRPGLAEIGDQFETYGEMFSGLGWLPLAGVWIERGRALSRLIAKAMQRRRQSSRSTRDRLTEALSELGHPIIVILDDIDRLSTGEIREIFKLVRLTANFPQVVYLLAFDRARVEQALDEDGVPGRAYLEKILQLAVDLPAVSDRVLQSRILDAINSAIGSVIENGPFDRDSWSDTFIEVIRPLISTMRDIRRYEMAVRALIPALGGQVDLGDALALEAVRVFLPNVYARIVVGIDGLTSTTQFGYDTNDPPELKEQVDAIISTAEDRGDVARKLIQRLFPAGTRHLGGSNYGSDWNSTWLRERRVANRDVLRLFLERTIGEELDTYLQAERALELANDADRLTDYLMAIHVGRRQDILSQMTNFADTLGAEITAPVLTALLNVLPYVPDQRRGMLDIGARHTVRRMIYLLLNRLNPEQVAVISEQVLPRVESLWGRFELITSIGHRENAGHKLITPEVASRLEAEWRQQVRDTATADLIREKPLLNLLWRTKTDAADGEPDLVVDPSPEMASALLRSAVSDARSQLTGNRAVHSDARLNWGALLNLVGGEDELRNRIEPLRTCDDPDVQLLITLCDRYFAGWRPD